VIWPPLCATELITGDVDDGVIAKLKDWVALWESLSFTPTVKLNVAGVVGVPLSTPLLESPIPGGKLPETRDQEVGGTPPAEASDSEYGTPTKPPGKEELVVMEMLVIDAKLAVTV
jgi:hypothetical protein